MILDRQSDRWNQLFGHLDDTWRSELPPHQAFIDGLVDPSVWPQALGRDEGMRGVLHAQGITDLQRGAQHMLRYLVTQADGIVPAIASTGVLSQLSEALTQSLTPQSLSLSIPQDLVAATLTSTNGQGGRVASALFAAGMTALAAAGPLGMAASAIIGAAVAIYRAVDKSRAWKEKERSERMRRAYELMPPLQQPGSDTDEWYVRTKIYPALQTGSWTRLFSPRFDPRVPWVGAPRNGGYAFAPGYPQRTKDDFGIKTAIFEATDGVGFVPGLNRITSVIQISLDPMGPDVTRWQEKSGRWPIKKAYVQDVGRFYVNATRLCAMIWRWATEQDASPNLYKLDVGDEQAPAEHSLHYQWREYMGQGLRYLQEIGADWDSGGHRLRDPADPSMIFGTAIGCAVTAWACYRSTEWTRNHPRFHDASPGYLPERIGVSEGLPNGCVIEPSAVFLRADGSASPCLRSLYESHIRRTLAEVRERQVYFLRHSLVCAYVREGWDAFREPRLRSLLRRMRQELLTHRDRHLVRLRDVPRDEPFGERTWREALVAAGVNEFQIGGLDRLGAGGGAITPTEEPAPKVLDLGQMPFAMPTDLPPPDPVWWQRRGLWLGVGAGAAALGGAYFFNTQTQRRRGQ